MPPVTADVSLRIGDGLNRLELKDASSEHVRELRARVLTPNLTAQHVFHDLEGGVADFRDLAKLLVGLADDWRGWPGERWWQSADDDFGIVVTHDGVGLARFRVSMRDYGEDWALEDIRVDVELGRLEVLARDAQAFFDSFFRMQKR